MNKTFYYETKDGVPLLRGEPLAIYKDLRHAFSTRQGGVSKGDMAALNLGRFLADDMGAVQENYRRFLTAGDFPQQYKEGNRQVHGDVVRTIYEYPDADAFFSDDAWPQADALITNLTGVTLFVYYADCVPILLYDPKRRVIGAVHAGWRGTAMRIAKKTVEEMGVRFGTRPRDIIALIGPAVCPDCYQVGDEVCDAFRKDRVLKKYVRKNTDGIHADLWNANAALLRRAGLRGKNIHVSEVCTMEEKGLYYSHRRNPRRGVQAAAIALLREGDADR